MAGVVEIVAAVVAFVVETVVAVQEEERVVEIVSEIGRVVVVNNHLLERTLPDCMVLEQGLVVLVEQPYLHNCYLSRIGNLVDHM